MFEFEATHRATTARAWRKECHVHAAIADMCGREIVAKPSLEVVYDDA